jgi:hypothetical protein
MNKTHWRASDKTDFLGACDLEEGKDLILTIEKVEIKEVKVRGTKGSFRVATFKEKGFKPMILNVTNAKIVKTLAKNAIYIEDWKNIAVSIYIMENVKFGVETVEALRIRPYAPQVQKPELFPNNATVWERAITVYNTEGNLDKVKEKYIISTDNESLLIDQAGLKKQAENEGN